MKKILYCISILLCCNAFANSQVESLSSFAKVYGIVRYYSPNPYTTDWSESDWFKVSYNYIKEYRTSGYDNNVLTEFLAVFAPNATLTTYPDLTRNDWNSSSPLYYNAHNGCGNLTYQISEDEVYSPYYCELSQIADNEERCPRIDQKYSYLIDNNLYLNIPIAEHKECFSEDEINKEKSSAEDLWSSTLAKETDMRLKLIDMFRDVDYRITDMIVRWNIVQHFYLYHNEDEMQWENHLADMIQAALSFPDEEREREVCFNYYDLVRKVMNPVKDSHLIVNGSMDMGGDVKGAYLGRYYSPLETQIINGKVIIKSVDPDAQSKLIGGSEIIFLNGEDITKVIDNNLCYVNSSNATYAKVDALQYALSSADATKSIAVTTLAPDGLVESDTLYLRRGRPYRDLSQSNSSYWISDSIAYFNPSVMRDSYQAFTEMMKRDNEFSAIIFDIREYPAYDFIDVLGHLTDSDMLMDNIHTPISYLPNRGEVYFKTQKQYIRSKDMTIDKQCVFLSDYTSMSYAETVLMLVAEYDLGTIIGTPSCGTNGDATRFDLPAFGFTMTALKATNIDGTRHHGVGVIPDVLVDMDACDSVYTNQDYILESAISYIKENNE